MKRIFLGIALSCLSAMAGYGQAAKHVILISIDGFRPDFYLDKGWPAPNLQKLMASGVYATGVNSVFPSVTYPAHTSLVTGANPGRHGIYYNSPQDAKNGEWYWYENQIKVPTLWDAVKQKGLTAGSVMWPVTVGAPITYNFPVKRADTGEKIDQLTVTRPVVSPPTLLDEVEQAIGTKLTAEDLNGDDLDRTTGKMASYIIAKHKPSLMAIHYLALDHAGHDYGRDHPHIKESLALVDSLIGNVLTTLDKAGIRNQAAIIITGDHGMVTRTTHVNGNVWLAQNGLLGKGSDWKAKFVGAGGSAFMYLKDKKDKATLATVRKILASLPADQKKLFRVVERKELDAVGANPEPVLALALAKGVAFGNAQEGEPVKPTKLGGTHGYFPDFAEIRTGFIASGAGINQGVKIQEMGITDVAPVIAHLLGLTFKAPDGKLYPQMLKK